MKEIVFVLMGEEEEEVFEKILLALGPLVERHIYLTEQYTKEFMILGRVYLTGNIRSITSNKGDHRLQTQ